LYHSFVENALSTPFNLVETNVTCVWSFWLDNPPCVYQCFLEGSIRNLNLHQIISECALEYPVLQLHLSDILCSSISFLVNTSSVNATTSPYNLRAPLSRHVVLLPKTPSLLSAHFFDYGLYGHLCHMIQMNTMRSQSTDSGNYHPLPLGST
jgi:hypothetical protein